MELGLKDRQDLDPWGLGFGGQSEGPSREGNSMNKSYSTEEIQGQPGGRSYLFWLKCWEHMRDLIGQIGKTIMCSDP